MIPFLVLIMGKCTTIAICRVESEAMQRACLRPIGQWAALLTDSGNAFFAIVPIVRLWLKNTAKRQWWTMNSTLLILLSILSVAQTVTTLKRLLFVWQRLLLVDIWRARGKILTICLFKKLVPPFANSVILNMTRRPMMVSSMLKVIGQFLEISTRFRPDTTILTVLRKSTHLARHRWRYPWTMKLVWPARVIMPCVVSPVLNVICRATPSIIRHSLCMTM